MDDEDGKKDDRSPWPARSVDSRRAGSPTGDGKAVGRGGRTGRGPSPRRDTQTSERGGRPPRREGPPEEREGKPPRRAGGFLYGTPQGSTPPPRREDRPGKGGGSSPPPEGSLYGQRPPRRDTRPPQGGDRPPRREGKPYGDRPPRREGKPYGDRSPQRDGGPPRGPERPPRQKDSVYGKRPPRRQAGPPRGDDRPPSQREGRPPQGGQEPPRRQEKPFGDRPPRQLGRSPQGGQEPPRRQGKTFGDRPPTRQGRPAPERREDNRGRLPFPRTSVLQDGPRPYDPVEPAQSQVGKRLAELNDIEVNIEKLVAGGDGLARFEGIPIFVPRSAPGDRLRVRLVERKGSFGRAEIEEILAPGPGRREAPCPHFARCGGCDLQHLEDDVQLRLKVQTVRENLLRIGHFEIPKDLIVVPGQNWGYRLRAQLHVAPSEERGNQVGYFARGSHDLVAVDSCPVLVPELEELLPQLNRRMRDESHRRIDLVVGDDKLSVSPNIPELPQGEVTLKVGEFTYSFDAGCFFQAHRQLLPQLVSHAVGELSGVAGDPQGEAFDLYSGVGLFSLPLSAQYRQVTAVEGERPAVRFAKKTARRHKVSNLEFSAQSVETWVAKLPKSPARVVVDPPRVGLSKLVRQALLESRPKHLTYISCNSATLGRDLADLTATYRATRLVLLDLFPQTGHLEAVVQLVDRASESS